MEVILWSMLLLSLNSGCGVSQTVYLSGNQTWNDASIDSTCSMLGFGLTGNIAKPTGDIEKDLDNISSMVWGTHQAAWIGAHVKRVWINFEGCYFGIFKHNDSGIALTSPGNPAKECLRYCNFSGFVLTGDKCVCYKNVTVASTGCIAGKCNDTKYAYCGRGTVRNSQNITFHCMCHFSMETGKSSISGDGNCLTVTYQPHKQLIATKCKSSYRPLCFDPNNNQSYLYESQNNWMQSLIECYINNKQFAGISARWIGNHNFTYWVGGFVVTYKVMNHYLSANDSCTAINISDNHVTLVFLPCGTLLPALCVNTSTPTNVTTEANILGTTSKIATDGVTLNQQIITNAFKDISSSDQSTTISGRVVSASTTSGQGGTSKSNQQTTTSGRVPTFSSEQLSTTHRQDGISNYDLTTPPRTEKSTHKQPKSSSTSSKQSSVPTVVGSVVGGVAMLIIIGVVVLLLRHRGVFRKFTAAKNCNKADDIEMRNPNKMDNGYTEVISTFDNVYNHLGELRTKQNASGDDLYDHTGDLSETYGQLHTQKNKYEDESEYDHTFNHTVSDTYGHLNSVYPRDNDNEYDHTFNHTVSDTYGHLNSVYPRDSDNEYDHTFTGTSDDKYGRLHTGRYRDGDVKMSKYPPEVESDYDHTRVT